MPRQPMFFTILCALFLAMVSSQLTDASPSSGMQGAEHSECTIIGEPGDASPLLAEYSADQPDNLSCAAMCVTSCSTAQAGVDAAHSPVSLTSLHSPLLYADNVIAVSLKPLLRPPIG